MNQKIKLSLVAALMGLLSFEEGHSASRARQNPLIAGPDVLSTQTMTLVKSHYEPGQIKALCEAAIARAQTRFDDVAEVPASERTVDNTLLALEKAGANLADETSPLTFMKYVSLEPHLAEEGAICDETLSQFNVNMASRRDLYEAILDLKPRNAAEERLWMKTKEGFELYGLKLSDDKLAQVKELRFQLTQKENQFTQFLNQDDTSVEFTEAELAGVSADFLQSLNKTPEGLLIVKTKSTHYLEVMQKATKSETRRRMQLAYYNRAAATNSRLLEEAVELRVQIAHLLGYASWADYRTVGRMVKDRFTAVSFLEGLKDKLAQRNQSDFDQLLKFKKEFEPEATQVNQWDILYLTYHLQERDFSLDQEKVKEYFPADVVVKGLFDIYSKMLGVRFVLVKNAEVWSPDVALYEIHNAADDRLIAFFYADFFPRQGKYGHAAAFPLITGRVLEDGTYSLPVSAIVSNFSPAQGGKPALLSHDEVETLFHEFGHIMHQTLTRGPFASLSGSSVAQDFVEAPSQMLENWVWTPQILSQISGHYLDHSQKLPEDLLKKMLALQDFGQGYFYTRQLLLGLYDLNLHTKEQGGAVNVTQVFDDLYRAIMKQEPIAGGHFAASFGHLMGGYDAGYYGYLWSKVYAEDMFTVFPSADLTSAEVGMKYRKVILEQGNMKDASDLLKEFLGREPNGEAFFKKLHID